MTLVGHALDLPRQSLLVDAAPARVRLPLRPGRVEVYELRPIFDEFGFGVYVGVEREFFA